MDTKSLTVINLLGGPGVGKSTQAAALFSVMKRDRHLVELVPEYAKDLVWDDRTDILYYDQGYIMAKQNRRLLRLVNKVDFAITDSPLILSCVYNLNNKKMGELKFFNEYCMSVFNSYSNINILLKRYNDYVPVGRTQTEEEATEIDNHIVSFMKKNDIEYFEVSAKFGECTRDIYKIIKKLRP